VRAGLRWGILTGALAATGLAALYAPEPTRELDVVRNDRRSGGLVEPERPLRSRMPRGAEVGVAADAPVVFPSRVPLDVAGRESVDVFAAKTWFVAPPPPPPRVVKLEPPPKPVAPTLPYTFMGRLGDDVVYLVGAGRTYAVKGGEVLDERYRVDRVTASSVEFTYLPLDEKQVLNLPAAR